MDGEEGQINKFLMVSCMLALFASTMVQTVLQLVFPIIGKELDLPSASMNIIVFLPIAAVFMSLVPVAVLADRFGKRNMFGVGLFILSVAMIGSALSFDYVSLALSRLLTGIAAAFLTCTVLSLVTDNSPRRYLTLCLGLCTAGSCLGATIAPTLGDVIHEIWGWRFIFVFGLAMAVLSYVLVAMSKCGNMPNEGRKLDHLGMILFAVGGFLFIFGLNRIPDIEGIVIELAGIAILFLFFVRESKGEQNTFRLRLMKNRNFSISCGIAVVFYMASIAVTYWASVYLIAMDDLPLAEISLIMAIAPLLQSLLAPLLAVYSDRFPPSLFPAIGLILVSVSLAALALCPSDGSHLEILIPVLVLTAISYAFFAVENNRNIMTSVKEEERNFASSMIGSMTALGRYMAMATVSCSAYLVASSMTYSAEDLHMAFCYIFPAIILLCIISVFVSRKMKAE